MLGLGLVLGMMLATGVYLATKGGSRFGDGLGTLIKKEAPTATTAAVPAPAENAKPRFAFYHLLTQSESVLPDRGAKPRADGTKPEANASYVLQIAAYSNQEEAERVKAELSLKGLEPYVEKVPIEGKGTFYRVRLGPFTRLHDLDTASNRLVALGIQALRVRVGNGGEPPDPVAQLFRRRRQ